MQDVETKDEYLHRPGTKRLWNESYYFDFNTTSAKGFTRLGFQPYERRANLWFYFIQDDRTFWFREENIPLESCHGLHADTGEFQQSYEIITPHKEWSLTATGVCEVANSSWEIHKGTDEEVELSADIGFTNPMHNASSIDLLVDAQNHYDQGGQFVGEVSINGDSFIVDGSGFRDHSWGWFRDWTPGKWGHYWAGFQFEASDCFSIVVQIRPDGSIRNTYGYHTNGNTIKRIQSADVTCNDNLERAERAEEWARGGFPEEIVFTLNFEDDQKTIKCTPTDNVPLGFEDRNWELSNLDAPWLKSFLNRMAVDCIWDSKYGSGWIEATHPL